MAVKLETISILTYVSATHEITYIKGYVLTMEDEYSVQYIVNNVLNNKIIILPNFETVSPNFAPGRFTAASAAYHVTTGARCHRIIIPISTYQNSA